MIAELSSAVTSVRAARDAAKLLLDVNKQFSEAQLRLKIAEVVGLFSDATDKVVDLKSQVSDLETEISSLKERLKQRDEMKLESGVYWRKKEDGANEGPFCPKCWIDKQKVAPMVPDSIDKNNKCVSCGRADAPAKMAVSAPFVVGGRGY
jgi:hypothetical protein